MSKAKSGPDGEGQPFGVSEFGVSSVRGWRPIWPSIVIVTVTTWLATAMAIVGFIVIAIAIAIVIIVTVATRLATAMGIVGFIGNRDIEALLIIQVQAIPEIGLRATDTPMTRHDGIAGTLVPANSRTGIVSDWALTADPV